MFATFTDWEFENMDGAPDTARSMWPMMQAAGATSFKATQTGENTVRTMLTWPDAETAQAAIERMRATALEKMPGKVISTTAGTIMVDLS
ncbi:hypothetical protein N9493_07565 [Amylibacter sp.]|nr:hypothetical protein [Amylibacter sp.]